MKFNIKPAALFALLLLASCSEKIVPELPVTDVTNSAIQGEVIVEFSDDMISLIESDLEKGTIVTKSSGLNSLCESMGILSMDRVFPDAGEYEERSRREGMHKWYKVVYDSDISVTRALSSFEALDGVSHVEPVIPVRNLSVFNDPQLVKQWHYINDGSLNQSHKAGVDINVEPVWRNYTTGSDKVVVAVVDGGVDGSHEDLKDNFIGGYNFISHTEMIKPEDHGTHVAGTIAAVNNNGKGVSGIAGGDKAAGKKGAKIMSCQIFVNSDEYANQGAGAEGIKWAADHGAIIAQNSWGYVFNTQAEAEKMKIDGSSLAKAIDYFIKYAGCDNSGNQKPDSPMKGGIVIFAAGNDNFSYDPIGAYEPVLSVGSVGPDGKKAYYSNHGDWVDIAAPGGSSKIASGQILSTLPDNKYGYMQGTSMACPHVSGVAALVISYCGGPGFTSSALREKLINGANKSVVEKSEDVGPLVDALGSILYGRTVAPDKVEEYTVEVKSNNLLFTLKVPKDNDDVKAYNIIALGSKDESLLRTIDLKHIPSAVKATYNLVGDLAVGAQMTAELKGLDFDSDYYVALAASDYSANCSPISVIKKVHTQNNNKPEINTDYTGDYKVKSHEVLNLDFTVTDPDGHGVSLSLDCNSKAFALAKLQKGTWRLTVTGNLDNAGLYDVRLVAKDEYGMEASKLLKIEILPNHPPVIVKPIEDIWLEGAGQKLIIDMSQHISDEDGEVLKYTFELSNPSVLHINPSANELYLTALENGQTTVKVTASDTRDAQVVCEFLVLIKEPGEAFDIYPNPVVDILNIRLLDKEQGKVTLTNSTGRKVFSEDWQFGDIKPMNVDMKGFAPGVYHLKIVMPDKTWERTVTKL